MPTPAPLIVPWRGREVRVRHDDPRLGPRSQRAAVIMSAMQLAGSVDGLHRALEVTVGTWYEVTVHLGHVPVVGLRRRTSSWGNDDP